MYDRTLDSTRDMNESKIFLARRAGRFVTLRLVTCSSLDRLEAAAVSREDFEAFCEPADEFCLLFNRKAGIEQNKSSLVTFLEIN